VFDIGTPCTPLKNPQHEALNTHTHTQAHTSTPTDARAHTPHLLIFGSNIRCCVLPIADGGFHVHWRVVVPARNLHPEFSEVSVLVHLPYKTNRKYFRILLPKISRCGVSVCERQKKKMRMCAWPVVLSYSGHMQQSSKKPAGSGYAQTTASGSSVACYIELQ